MSEDVSVEIAAEVHQLKTGYQLLATRTEDLLSSISGFQSGLVRCNQETEARVHEVEQRIAAFETWLSAPGIKDMEERLAEHGKRMASWEEEILSQLAGTKSAFKDLLASISGLENGLESVSRDSDDRLSAEQEGQGTQNKHSSEGSNSEVSHLKKNVVFNQLSAEQEGQGMQGKHSSEGSNSEVSHLLQIKDLEARLATIEGRLDFMSTSQSAEALDSQLTIPSQDWKDLEARLASFDSKLERLSADQRVDAPYEARLASFERRLDEFLSQKAEEHSAPYEERLACFESRLDEFLSHKLEEQSASRTEKPTEVERELGNAAYRGAIETELRSMKATMHMQLTQHKLEFTMSLQDARQRMEELAARFFSHTKSPAEQICKLESCLEESRKSLEFRIDESCNTFEVRLAAHVLDMDLRLTAYQNQLDKFVEARLGTHIQEALRHGQDVDRSIRSFQRQLDSVPRVEDADERIKIFQRQPERFDVATREGSCKIEREGHSGDLPIYQTDSPRQRPTPAIIPRLASPVPSYIPTLTPPRMVSAGTSSPMVSGGTPAPPPGITSPRAASLIGRAPSPGTMYVTQRVAAVPAPLIGMMYAPSATAGS